MRPLPDGIFSDMHNALRYLISLGHDNSEHLLYLAGIGAGRDVVEFGFRNGFSATAFLVGGCRTIISYDIQDYPETRKLLASDRLTFVKSDSLEASFDQCDVLFIDSDHRPEHLFKELTIHAPKVKSLIAMHDTFCRKCPTLREGMIRFLTDCPEWGILVEFKNNNGLSVICRR